MHDIQPILQTLTEALLRKLGDEVDLIFQYGSHLRGNTHQYSDVDISYVPVHEATWDSITVMVGETMCDLYPIHWSHLERMADFRSVSASVLLNHRILYQRTEAAGARMQALAARLRALQAPEARPDMVRRAQEIFQETGYGYYLLRRQAEAGHLAGCLKQAHAILQTVLHCLAVYNQACIDTRKLAQALALPSLPPEFGATVQRVLAADEVDELLTATDALLHTTRELLLAGQRELPPAERAYSTVFDAAYPELKRDLQGVMLACERQDMLAVKSSLFSLLHELSRAIAEATTGFVCSDFHGLSEYEADWTALGFPPLLPYAVAQDFAGLRRQCLAFDRCLQTFLSERGVSLNRFATLDELQSFLGAR